MNRKGVSNIEFILAFILFIGFVVSALYFLNPVRSTKILESSATYTVNEIVKNTTVGLDSYSVKVAGETSIKIDNVAQNKQARVENYKTGEELPSRRGSGGDSNMVYFERANAEDFIVVQFSEDFDPGSYGATTAHDSDRYKIASSTSEEIVSEKRMGSLKSLYEADYSLLKEQLDIAPGIDYSFSLALSDRTIAVERNIPAGVEVFSETRTIRVLKEDGSSEFAYLTVRIW
jgi:hypothetical protein